MSDKNLKKIRVVSVTFFPKPQFIVVEPASSRKKAIATLSDGQKLCISKQIGLMITFANDGRPDSYNLYPYFRKKYPRQKVTVEFLDDLQRELIGKEFEFDGESILGLDPILAKIIKKK